MPNETYHPRGELVDGYRVREHPSYMVWAGMKSRCSNPNEPGYENYGARGITYCDRWKDFANFAADMGQPPFDGAEIDRVNNDDGYHPGNCRWATGSQQSHNRRTFKNNTSGYSGVVAVRGGRFQARYDDKTVRYDLGRFDTVDEAAAVRAKFIDLFERGDASAWSMLSSGKRRLRFDSSTGIKGITRHTKGGFLVRKTVNGKRLYLGFATTLPAAVEILRGAA